MWATWVRVGSARPTRVRAVALLSRNRVDDSAVSSARIVARGVWRKRPWTRSHQPPIHYQAGTPEVIDVIEGWNLGYRLGNVVKYILRSEHKDGALADLKKAKWYLDREIMRAMKRRQAQ